MTRLALGIEYCGANYYGWQRQNNVESIQSLLETAIAKVADHPITIFCAGRTDAGVHATHQVIHIDVTCQRELIAWVRGVNTHLPPDIRVLWAKEMSDDFHARRSATARRYVYIILNQAVSPGILHQRVTWVHGELDVPAMQKSAQHLLGEHDFSSFRAAHCQAKTPVRTITAIDVSQRDNRIILDVTANAFLHHMVRNIAGSLLAVGRGYNHPDWLKEVLLAKDRREAGLTASPHGLYLIKVTYPDKFQLPNEARHPWI